MTINISGIEIHVKKQVVALLAFVLTAVLGITGFYLSRNNKPVVFDSTDETPFLKTFENNNGGVPAAATVKPDMAGSGADDKSGTANTTAVQDVRQEEIKVYIIGCVKNKGIVTLKKGQIIDDAIKAAGGATTDADLENINLVYKLDNNVMLNIRSKKETAKANAKGTAAAQSRPVSIPANAVKTGQTAGAADAAGKGVVIISDSGGAIVNEAASGNASNGKININTASIDELDTLPYIGKETAKHIISYREKSGAFKTIADVMKVSGIKQSRFDKIKDYITVN